MSLPPLTLGTAGHIDHGKTALVRALTGVDTDRLAQERARGITIELGYASLRLPGGRRLSLIDVPGHERFVRTMVAGATGIDLFVMTIAADDGVMPQTREHAAVLRALDIRSGVVAVTKTDLADPALAARQAAELLPRAEVVAVSSRNGSGISELGLALERAAEEAVASRTAAGPDDAATQPARLHIDRVFTIRGAGTVVTGTLWSGTITRGEQVSVLPQRLAARVRAVQVHDAAVPEAGPGQRVALNLTGVRVPQLSRGDVVVSTGSRLGPASVLDCELSFERGSEPDHGARVQIHHGTREAAARLAWLGERFWQVRLERPLVAADGDRLVVRQIAPPDTIGGGRVLDSAARRHGAHQDVLGALNTRPAPGAPVRPVRTAPESSLSPSALALGARLRAAGLNAPPDSELDADDLAALRAAGHAIRVSRKLHLAAEVVAEMRGRVVAMAKAHEGAVTLSQVRDELGTSRKYAQALLEHLDSERVLIRRGEVHALRGAPGPQDATQRGDGS